MFSLKPLNDQFSITTTITSLSFQINKNNKRFLRTTNNLISATKLTTITRTIVNQKTRIRITIAIVIIIAITTNKLNTSSMHLEPDSQPNPSISVSAVYTKYTSLSLGHETSIYSAKPLSTILQATCNDSICKYLISVIWNDGNRQ
jgi:hypothetical protein